MLDINLGKLVGGSQLISGFAHELPSLALIIAAIQKQNDDLAKGRARDTGVSADKFAVRQGAGSGLNVVDVGSYQNAAHPPLSAKQLRNFFNGQNRGRGVFGTPGGRGFVPLSF